MGVGANNKEENLEMQNSNYNQDNNNNENEINDESQKNINNKKQEQINNINDDIENKNNNEKIFQDKENKNNNNESKENEFPIIGNNNEKNKNNNISKIKLKRSSRINDNIYKNIMNKKAQSPSNLKYANKKSFIESKNKFRSFYNSKDITTDIENITKVRKLNLLNRTNPLLDKENIKI